MTPGLWDKGSPDSGWVRRHFPSFEDRDVLLSDMDKYLSTIANQVLVAGLLAGLAFSALFSVERGKFTAKAGMYEPCVVSVSMVLVTNVSALVFYLAIYHFVIRGTTLEALQASANLAGRLEWLRKVSLGLLKAGFICMLLSTALWAVGTVGGATGGVVSCLVISFGIFVLVVYTWTSHTSQVHYRNSLQSKLTREGTALGKPSGEA